MSWTSLDWISWLTAGAGVFATVFAGLQIYLSRLESQKRIAFEHIRQVLEALEPLWAFDAVDMKRELKEFYGPARKTMTEGAHKYLSFLTSADLLAYAVEKKSADKKIASEYLATLLRSSLLAPEFLLEFQKCCEDDETLEHLTSFVKQHSHLQ